MKLTILAASGATGLELTRQALERGHTVTAIARTPGRVAVPDSSRLIRVAADVRDPESIAAALAGQQIVLSGLGNAGGAEPGALTAGARAVVAARPARIVWLGAFGTGPSAGAAGAVTRTLLKLMGGELADKVTADAAVLAAGGTVFHAGPLSNRPPGPTRYTAGLDEAPRRLFPARVSRATVAAAMLDEAENPVRPGAIALPLERRSPRFRTGRAAGRARNGTSRPARPAGRLVSPLSTDQRSFTSKILSAASVRNAARAVVVLSMLMSRSPWSSRLVSK